MSEEIVKKGDIVEYLCVAGLIHCEVLDVKQNGKLVLNTRKEHKLLNPRKNGATTVFLNKNVCIKPTKVKLFKQNIIDL